MSTAATTVNGSYHYYTDKNTLWHNQLTGTNTVCAVGIAAPHAGDGNARYDAGYNWFPYYYRASFDTNVVPNKNECQLDFKFTSSYLQNLQVDNNETLEAEILFYDYNLATNVSKRGTSFMYSDADEGTAWYANFENAYLDTNISDEAGVKSFCIGISDTSELTANQWYTWRIRGNAGTQSYNYINDGRFCVSVQRGYRVLTGTALDVFGEEHEKIIFPGLVPPDQNWLADVNAWDLAANDGTWTYTYSVGTTTAK